MAIRWINNPQNTSPASTDKMPLTSVSGGNVDNYVTPSDLITKAHGLSDGIIKVSGGVMTDAVAGTDYPSGSGTSTGSNTGDQTITLTGDVTGSGTGSFATTLGTVTIAKGGTGQTTAQNAINALTAVSSATNEYVLTKDTGTGNAIWKVSAGGGSFSWGATATGTSGTGVALTVGNSASASTVGQSITIGNTQTNAATGLSINTGTSSVSNTGLQITIPNASSNANAINIINSSCTGSGLYFSNVGSAGYKFINLSSSVNNGGAASYAIYLSEVNGSTGTGYGIYMGDISSAAAGTGIGWYVPELVANFAYSTEPTKSQYFSFNNSNSAALVARTVNTAEWLFSRTNTRTSTTVTDNFNLLYMKRTNVQNGAGGTLAAQGAVLKLENVATQTAGTLTDTTYVLDLEQGALTSTHFKKVINAAGTSIYVSDGTTPNAALTGNAGDLCLNGPSGHMFYCTTNSSTTWTQI